MPPLKRRILCVDDDEDTCEALTQLLKRENYEARAVDSVQAALELAHKESFNLYILDSWFLEEGGTVLCQRIREFDPQTPIVIYSGAAFGDCQPPLIRPLRQITLCRHFSVGITNHVKRKVRAGSEASAKKV